jgi:hypothetical protein
VTQKHRIASIDFMSNLAREVAICKHKDTPPCDLCLTLTGSVFSLMKHIADFFFESPGHFRHLIIRRVKDYMHQGATTVRCPRSMG